jgi:DNA-binding MarR family transcriptional regulator
MLGAIALANKPISAPRVGSVMGVTRQGAQKQLNLLLEQGLVVSLANPAHRRSPVYELTPLGRELYLQAERQWATHVTDLAARIPPARARAASTTLEAMLRQLDLTQPIIKELP